MKSESLILYSKFDQETGINYIKPNDAQVNEYQYTELVDNFEGPFSIPNSSYRTNITSPNGHSLCFVEMASYFQLQSFTVSFYLRVIGNETVGIFYDDHDFETGFLRFSLTAVNFDLEFHIHNSSSPSWETISSFTFQNVLKANDWKFVALTYDATSKQLKLYDETANVKQEQTNVEIDQVSTWTLAIGGSIRFASWEKFTRSSAIACFSLHNQALSQTDIALLPCACQFKDRQLI